MKLVLVEWLDSHAGRGWLDIEHIEQAAEPLLCRSVGWLLVENDECAVLVAHLSGQRGHEEPFQGRGDLTIPKQAIVKMTPLNA